MTIPSALGRLPSPLVGRAREQGILHDRFAATLAGQGGLVLIGGEAGIGKTALAESLCREASGADALVLIGRCYDLTETPPYGPWVDMFARYREEQGLPALPTVFAERGTIGAVTSQATLLRQMQEFVSGVTARRPLVLLLDDMHWADPASMDLFRFLARTSADCPLLVLLTYRSDELTHDHPLYPLLPVLVREADTSRLDLRRLETKDVQALISTRYNVSDADTVRLATHLYDRANGNPFFIGEILRTLEEEHLLRGRDGRWSVGDLAQTHVPLLIRQVIERRLTRLDVDARRLLAVAAVIGQEIPLPLWSTVAQADNDALLSIIERAVAAHLLAETPDRTAMRFVHALIRETLYDGISLLTRRAWHQQIAEALIIHPHPDPDTVANHFQRAGDTRAVEWLVRAGDRAQRAYAWRTAIERYRVALDLMERTGEGVERRCWLLCLLGLLHRYTDARQGIAYLEHAGHLATLAEDPMLEATALFYRGHLRNYAGDWTRGMDEVSAGIAALDAFSPADRERFLAMIAGGGMANEHNPWASYSVGLVLTGRYAASQRLAERLIAALPDGGEPWARSPAHCAGAYFALGDAHATMGRFDEARQMWSRARDAYRALDHFSMWSRTAMAELTWGVLAYQPEHQAERERIAAEAEWVWARAGGSLWYDDFSPRCGRITLLILEGEWEEARRLVSLILRIPFLADDFRYEVARLARWQGETAHAWKTIQTAMPLGPHTPPGSLCFHCGLGLHNVAASLALDVGDLATARDWLAAYDRWLAWSGAVLGRAEGQLAWAAYHRAIGDSERASECASAALKCASNPRQPLALLAAHRMIGILDTDRGRFDSAETHFEASLAMADACAAPYERAQTLMAMAELAHARNSNACAQTLLAEVRAICVPLGAKPLLTNVEALVTRIDDVVPSASRYPGGLTAREVEVLRLAAQGLSNAEIAAHLFLSVHTVHRHMANILTKLDLPSRVAAVAYAMRYGIL